MSVLLAQSERYGDVRVSIRNSTVWVFADLGKVDQVPMVREQ